MEAIPKKKAEGAPTTVAETERDYCDRLFHLEETLKNLSTKERKIKPLELEKPVLDAFWCWLDTLEPLKGSALGKAVTYAKNQKPYMKNYLLDGRCVLSNNSAENAIHPFTVGRKNCLSADTPKGADASAMVYSIVETAKANGINVYAYLQYLIINMAHGNWHTEPGVMDMLMPWSGDGMIRRSLLF